MTTPHPRHDRDPTVTKHPTNLTAERRALVSIHELVGDLLRSEPGDRTVFDEGIAGILNGLAGQPGSQSFEQDRTSGHTTRTDEDGTPMPAVSDPAGEAAIGRDDVAADLAVVRQLCHAERIVVAAHAALSRNRAGCGAPHGGHGTRAPSDIEARTAAGEGCDSCRRVDEPTKPHVTASKVRVQLPDGTQVDVLDRHMALCVWCYRVVRHNGLEAGLRGPDALPSRDLLRRHHAGERIKLRVGQAAA